MNEYVFHNALTHRTPVLQGSLFGSNIGSEHFVGLAGWGCSGGLAASLFELSAIVPLLCLRFIIRTMPEYIVGDRRSW